MNPIHESYNRYFSNYRDLHMRRIFDCILYTHPPVPLAEPPYPSHEVVLCIPVEIILPDMIQMQQWSDFYGHIAYMSSDERMACIHMKLLLQKLQMGFTYLKIRFLETIDANVFYNKAIKDLCFELFCRYQRMHHLFSRLKYRWKLRRATLQITTDLFMNELDPTHKYTIDLYHENARYLFSMIDLARMWMSAITNASSFFSIPIPVKNPYTNIPFTKSELCTIYHRMWDARFRIPLFIQYLYRCNLNIYEFKRNHDPELRSHILREYAMKTDAKELAIDVQIMLRVYDKYQTLSIHPDFPVDQLVNPLRVYLYYYYQRLYAYEKSQRKYYECCLLYKLKPFIFRNPLFGRRRPVERGRFDKYYPTPTFYTEIVKEYNYPPLNYLTDHQYNEYTFNRYMLYIDQPVHDPTYDAEEHFGEDISYEEESTPHSHPNAPLTPPRDIGRQVDPDAAVQWVEYPNEEEEEEPDTTAVYMENEEDSEETDTDDDDIDETDYDP